MRRTAGHSDSLPTGPVFGFGLALKGTVHHGEDYSAGEFRSVFNPANSSCQLNLKPGERKLFVSDPELRRRTFRELAGNIALVVNVLNLKKVILGGFFHGFKESYEDIFREEIVKNGSYPDLVNVSVRLSAHGAFAVPFGAASFILEKIFNISGEFGSEFLSTGYPDGSPKPVILRGTP